MAYQLSEINRQVAQNPKDFLLESDERFHQKIQRTAETIAHANSPVVLLSGPSGSGKTTTAMKLGEALNALGVRTHAISMDDYFCTIDPKTAPRTPEGDIDFESPACLDLALLQEHFSLLEAGKEIRIPKFDFSRNMRNDAAGRRLCLEPGAVAIFEGIHALRDEISNQHPEATKLYISARSDVVDGGKVCFKGTWMRLVRRAVRDYQFRGSDVGETLTQWANVRRGEKQYISPYKYKADLILDSSLPYEVPVMKYFALPLLEAVPQDNPRREELLHLIDAFGAFQPLNPGLVPPDSLLREFIGGGRYLY